MAGHADLRLATEPLAGFFHRSVILPQMNAIGAQPLGQADRIVDDEGHFARCTDCLERRSQPRGFVFVDALHAELEGRDRTGIKCAGQPLGKVAADVQRRDQVKLAVAHGLAP